jgi:hypothetical protein
MMIFLPVASHIPPGIFPPGVLLPPKSGPIKRETESVWTPSLLPNLSTPYLQYPVGINIFFPKNYNANLEFRQSFPEETDEYIDFSSL